MHGLPIADPLSGQHLRCRLFFDVRLAKQCWASCGSCCSSTRFGEFSVWLVLLYRSWHHPAYVFLWPSIWLFTKLLSFNLTCSIYHDLTIFVWIHPPQWIQLAVFSSCPKYIPQVPWISPKHGPSMTIGPPPAASEHPWSCAQRSAQRVCQHFQACKSSLRARWQSRTDSYQINPDHVQIQA